MPNRIDEIFFEKHRVNRSTLEKLSKDEVDDLRRIALERPDNPNRVRALGFLVQLEDSETRDAIRRILANPDENGDVRAAAAALVTRIGSDADSALIEGLRYAPEPFVRRRIAASLGEIGSRRAGEALRELARDDDRGVRTQAEFSLSLLAAREGIDGFRLPIPSRDDILQPQPDDACPFTVHRASLGETARVLDSLGQRTFGLSVTREGVYAIACERDHMMLAFDERFARDDVVKWVMSRPNLVALVAAPAPDEDAYAVQWLVFAWPENRERLHLAVHRTSGQQVLYGVATVEVRAINFSLESLRGPGRLAIRLRGWCSDGKLEVHEAVAARRREPAMVPQPFELRGGPRPSD